MHNSVKLLCARPEKDAQPFVSSWGGTEDRNREFFFKFNAPIPRKVQKVMLAYFVERKGLC